MTALTEQQLVQLQDQGWTRFSYETPDQLSSFANQLGKQVPSRRGGPLVDRLSPTQSAAAHPASLSKRYGEAGFPFHTDGAHHPQPPRFVALGCEVAAGTERETLLLDPGAMDLGDVERDALVRLPWLFSGGQMPFYATILSAETGTWRYDPGCMQPTMGQDAPRMLESPPAGAVHRTSLKGGDGLLWDNHRILHARGPGPSSGEQRIILRAMYGGAST